MRKKLREFVLKTSYVFKKIYGLFIKNSVRFYSKVAAFFLIPPKY